MQMTFEHFQGRVPVTVLRLQGDLDASSYQAVIAQAQTLYAAGVRHLLVDMHQTPFMGSSGLVALHAMAALMRGEAPPGPEAGWEALHALNRDRESGMQQHLKLLGVQPQVDRVLERSGLKRYFEVHTDLQAAVASF